MISTASVFGILHVATGSTWRMVGNTVVKGTAGSTTLCLSPIVEITDETIPLTTTSDQVKKLLNGKVLASELTADEIAVITSLYPAWEPGIVITPEQFAAGVDLIYSYDLTLWRVSQAHTFQADWTPPDVPALFARCVPANVIAEWEQRFAAPYYRVGDVVSYQGWIWECTAADANGNNAWAPGVYGWTQVEPV